MQMAASMRLGPLGPFLQRRFSIVRTISNRKVLRRASEVTVGEAVGGTAEGQMVCQVEKVMPSSISYLDPTRSAQAIMF